jgi:hypothetical protein
VAPPRRNSPSRYGLCLVPVLPPINTAREKDCADNPVVNNFAPKSVKAGKIAGWEGLRFHLHYTNIELQRTLRRGQATLPDLRFFQP